MKNPEIHPKQRAWGDRDGDSGSRGGGSGWGERGGSSGSRVGGRVDLESGSGSRGVGRGGLGDLGGGSVSRFGEQTYHSVPKEHPQQVSVSIAEAQRLL